MGDLKLTFYILRIHVSPNAFDYAYEYPPWI